jgi:hypothetical protein
VDDHAFIGIVEFMLNLRDNINGYLRVKVDDILQEYGIVEIIGEIESTVELFLQKLRNLKED